MINMAKNLFLEFVKALLEDDKKADASNNSLQTQINILQEKVNALMQERQTDNENADEIARLRQLAGLDERNLQIAAKALESLLARWRNLSDQQKTQEILDTITLASTGLQQAASYQLDDTARQFKLETEKMGITATTREPERGNDPTEMY